MFCRRRFLQCLPEGHKEQQFSLGVSGKACGKSGVGERWCLKGQIQETGPSGLQNRLVPGVGRESRHVRELGTSPPDWPQCLGLAEARTISCDIGQVMKNLRRDEKGLTV